MVGILFPPLLPINTEYGKDNAKGAGGAYRLYRSQSERRVPKYHCSCWNA